MALTNEQKARLINILDQQSEAENDAILRTIDNFTHFLYYACRDIFDAIHYVLRSTWQWLKSIFE